MKPSNTEWDALISDIAFESSLAHIPLSYMLREMLDILNPSCDTRMQVEQELGDYMLDGRFSVDREPTIRRFSMIQE